MAEHSVTTTASYVLNKYSRSYPSTPSLGCQADEWQHFTNPVMRIILEVKKSPSGQLVSMRLKILWGLHTSSIDLHTDQREVVFEDLELLSFSSSPTLQASVHQSDQSLPLKAVYRDAVVGIRYLHPRIVPLGSPPTYRRFQIAFKDAMDASRCIDAIKFVCPCKVNPHPTHVNRRSTMLSASLSRTATTLSHPPPARPTGPSERQSVILASTDSRPVPSVRPPDNHAFSIGPSDDDGDGSFVTCPETSHRSELQVDHRAEDLSKSRDRNWTQSSLPSSSQLSSSDQSISMPPPPVPRRATHPVDPIIQEQSKTANAGDERAQLLASLSKHPYLYELSRTDLETLVSQVIREEGFLHLLESLDSLWRVKGFLGR